MILCTSSNISVEEIKRIHMITKENVWQGRIVTLSADIKARVRILLTYGNYDDSVTIEDLESLPNLQWIQSMSSGTEQLPLDFIAKKKILLTSARGVHAIPISEYALAMFLFFAKKVMRYQLLKESMVWDYSEGTSELYGKKVGILGTGIIGQAIAEKAMAFGMIPLGVNRSGRAVSGFRNIYSLEQIEECLPHCDYICSALPSNKQSRNLINSERIALMKEGVFFVNVGRGDLIVEEDFIQALQTGKIAGAALDVFRDEPLAFDHPFWHEENLIITPHASSKTKMYIPRVIDLFEENYRYFVTDKWAEMFNRID